MAKTYAWTNLVVERDEWGRNTKVLVPGDEVDQKALKIDDASWQELLDSGAVRDIPYPEDVPEDKSPQEFIKEQVIAGEMTLDEGNEALGANTAEAETVESESKPAATTTTTAKK